MLFVPELERMPLSWLMAVPLKTKMELGFVIKEKVRMVDEKKVVADDGLEHEAWCE